MKRKGKIVLALSLAIVILLSLGACGGGDKSYSASSPRCLRRALMRQLSLAA